MSREEYYEEALGQSLCEHAPGVVLTVDQIRAVANDLRLARSMEAESFGDLCISNPQREENIRLKKQIEIERNKQVCPECKGRGSITEIFGPIGRSSTSQCHKCYGEGKI